MGSYASRNLSVTGLPEAADVGCDISCSSIEPCTNNTGKQHAARAGAGDLAALRRQLRNRTT